MRLCDCVPPVLELVHADLLRVLALHRRVERGLGLVMGQQRGELRGWVGRVRASDEIDRST